MARTYLYKVGIGKEGVALKYQLVRAANIEEARSIGISKYLHPDLGYDHIEVTRVKLEGGKSNGKV